MKVDVAKRKKVDIYGASTKSNTVLQYFGLDHRHINAVAERNLGTWGKVTEDINISIISEKEKRETKSEYFLVLPSYFIEEFKHRETELLKYVGMFIFPAPHFALIWGLSRL